MESGYDELSAAQAKLRSGKSSFIRRCTGHASEPVIGETSLAGLVLPPDDVLPGLTTAETKSFQPYVGEYGGRKVIFLDTPGFDDDTRDDVETLRQFVTWLHSAFVVKIKLAGILIMYEASRARIGGSGLRTLERIRMLAGEQASAKVYLVSTKWQDLSVARKEAAERGFLNLPSEVSVWGDLMRDHAEHKQLRGDSPEYARPLLGEILARNITTDLLIQTELASGMEFRDTKLGKAVGLSVEEVKEKHQKQITDLERKYEEKLKANQKGEAERIEKALGPLKKEHENLKAAAEEAKKSNEKATNDLIERYNKDIANLEQLAKDRERKSNEAERNLQRKIEDWKRASADEKEQYASQIGRLEAQLAQYREQAQVAASRSSSTSNMWQMLMAGLLVGDLAMMAGGGFGGGGFGSGGF